MSLLSALQVGSNALTASQIGLNVTGHNISNANTPGYIRQDVEFVPAPTQRIGQLNIGLGVRVSEIVQKVDSYVQTRLRDARADVASGEAQENAFFELETLLGELSDADLSTAINEFFSSIHDVVNQPETLAVRNVAVLEGQQLTAGIRRLATQVRDIRSRLNDEIKGTVNNINDLLNDIAELNVQIVDLEGGGASPGKALSLRDQRGLKLDELSKLVDVRAIEQEDGTVNVVSGGEFLVSRNVAREIEAVPEPNDYLNAYKIQIKATDGPLTFSSGKLDGLIVSRDEIIGGFEDQLDQITQTLAFEFNRAFSQGQGLKGYRSLRSQQAITDSTQPLDAAGLPYPPENGVVQLAMRNTRTGETVNHQFRIELNGLETDTTVDQFVSQLNDVEGLQAQISSDGHLNLSTTDSSLEFSFGEDTSGVLAAYGLNTFFQGTTAYDIAVNDVMIDDPSLFAASQGGVGQDVENALVLAELAETGFESTDGQSLNELYAELVSSTAQNAATTSSVAEGYRVYANTLESQHLSVAGVNLDEEALNLLTYQRSYQAAARYIQTVNEMLSVLLNI